MQWAELLPLVLIFVVGFLHYVVFKGQVYCHQT